MRLPHIRLRRLSHCLPLGLMIACSGGGGSSGSTQGPADPLPAVDFQVVSISLENGTLLPLNRPVLVRFNHEVDFASVSNTSIEIRNAQGVAAVGSFAPLLLDTDADGRPDASDPMTVQWQPACPTLPDYSDAGLSNLGEPYTLRLRGIDSGGPQVLRDTQGRELKTSATRSFSTPNSSDPSVLFEDPRAGAPAVVVRTPGDSRQAGVTRVELGGDIDLNAALYFERQDPLSQSSVVPGPAATGGVLVPLNLYSDAAQSVVFVVEFDQPINPATRNLASDRLRLEYQLEASGPQWIPIETEVTLVQNCGSSGAQVRLAPVGILPPGSQVRAIVGTGFEGLVGLSDRTLSEQNRFAVVGTRTPLEGSLPDPSALADEILLRFDQGGSGRGSFQDVDANLGIPDALWGGGSLRSNLNFPGDGGLGGNFDWVVRQALESFDTSEQVIVGGPNQTRSLEQLTTGGVVNVNDFIIRPGARLLVLGPNPFVVNATGEIRIEGELDASGVSARDVISLNTGAQPEPGGSGNCGGGDGGTASSVRNNSTPRGDSGFGPLGQGATGGQGGESGAGPNSNVIAPENRRPGGGGGGRFHLDQDDRSATSEFGQLEPSAGMRAQSGGDGHAQSRGAVSGQSPAMGGAPGVGPFVDGDPRNDFFGQRIDVDVSIPFDGMPPVAGAPRGIIAGELLGLHAGYGGGGGGDALPAARFPTPNWTVSSDEKGGGGGGGGGAVRLRALGPIRFVGLGSHLSCSGGRGAIGESFIFVDRIGGTGGSGSGGHVILESASQISFELPPVDQRPAGMRRHVFIDARGRAGRVGLPTNQAPLEQDLLNIPQDVSFGGTGGPGLIQLHVPDALTPPQENPSITDIVLPVGTEAELNAGDANALHEVMRPAGVQLLSNFAGASSAQTRWIDLRRTELNPDGSEDLVRFLFEGIDPLTGSVLATNGLVDELEPILSGTLAPGLVEVLGTDCLRIRGAALQPLIDSGSNDLYLRTPALLRDFILRIRTGISLDFDFAVQAATYDGDLGMLDLSLNRVAGLGIGQLVNPSRPVSYRLIPRYFSIKSGGVLNALPMNSDLRVRFEAAREDPSGRPDALNPLVPLTSDVSELNALLPGELDFLRLRFDLNVDVQGTGLSLQTPTLELDFLRLPFRF